MRLREFPRKIGISRKIGLVNVVLLANAFIWYFLAFSIIRELIASLSLSETETLAVLGVDIISMAVSGVVGSIVVEKLGKRARFLYLWTFVGIFLSVVPAVFTISTYLQLTIFSCFIGLYFGLGMPATMGYFAASTNSGSRSRIAGLSFLFIALAFSSLGNVGLGNITFAGLILTAVRVIGFFLLSLLRISEKVAEKRQKISYTQVLSNRSFILYFIPWCMFLLVNYLTVPVQNKVFLQGDTAQFSAVLENILVAIFAVVSGFLADILGRKRLVIIGFAILGIGYAALGLSPTLAGWYFYTIVDGIAWGIFFTLLLFTIWGDLAQERNSEKFYVIGALPYLLSNFMRIALGSFVSGIAETAIFSFASFFLFLAVLPLVYAPETLPDKVMKDRDLKSYLEKAKKKVQKDSEKKHKKEDNEPKNGGEEPERKTGENSKEYVEAQKLAEKYY